MARIISKDFEVVLSKAEFEKLSALVKRDGKQLSSSVAAYQVWSAADDVVEEVAGALKAIK